MSADNKPSIVSTEHNERVPFEKLVKTLTNMGLETKLDPETSSFAQFRIDTEQGDVRKVTIEANRPNGRVTRCILSEVFDPDTHFKVMLGFVGDLDPKELIENGGRSIDQVSFCGNYPLAIKRIQSGSDSRMEKNVIYFVCKGLLSELRHVVSINQDGMVNFR